MLEGLSAGERLRPEVFAELKQRAVSHAFKWNVMDAGLDKLCDFPLLITPALWRTLSEWAVRLEAEAEQAEAELLRRPLLCARLGLPLSLQSALRANQRAPALRYARFDFHPTAEGGFAITEGNLDVAGGWNEAGGVTELFAEHVRGAASAGDPADALARDLAARLDGPRRIGIMHLTHYTDDHQVARFQAQAFARHGLEPVLFDPRQLTAADGVASAYVGAELRALQAVFRFFPADWACDLERPRQWLSAASQPGTLWINPLSTVLTQSKRFPLTWPELSVPLPTWSRLMPETRSPWAAGSGDWVMKPAFGNEGYRVSVPGVTPKQRASSLGWRAHLRPWGWAAQRMFAAQPIATPAGPHYPCLGVYVIAGRAVGLYGRLAPNPLIDADAREVVVLVNA